MSKEETARSALKLALEALSVWEDMYPQYWDELDDKAITVLREELAKPDFWEGYVPEPVKPRGEATLAQQEPVAYLCEPDENGLYGLPLTEKTCTKCFPVYRHPQRTWVGLTDEEVMEIAFNFDVPSLVVRTVEAKLRSKNEDRN